MEAAVVWKAAMKPRLPTRLGKRYALPTAPTALLPENTGERTNRDPNADFAELDVHNSGEGAYPPLERAIERRARAPILHWNALSSDGRGRLCSTGGQRLQVLHHLRIRLVAFLIAARLRHVRRIASFESLLRDDFLLLQVDELHRAHPLVPEARPRLGHSIVILADGRSTAIDERNHLRLRRVVRAIVILADGRSTAIDE